MTTAPLPGPRGAEHLRLLRTIFRDPPPVLDELRDRYGPVSGLGAGPARLAIVGSADTARELLDMPNDRFRWGHKFNVLGFVVGPESMIVSDGPDHRRRRAAVHTAFSRRRLNSWIPMIIERTDAMIDQLPAPSAVNLTPHLRLLVMRIAVHAFFGSSMAERTPEFADLFERPQAYLESPAIRQFPHPFPHTNRSRVKADRRALDTIIDGEIARLRSAPSGDPDDVLDHLVQEGALSDAEIRDQVVTLIGAGYDTTAAALAWTVTEAGAHPTAWSRLRAEANEEMFDGPFDHTTLARLRFADAVMHESLRLHPPGSFAPREAVVDIELGGHTIRRGTLILWSPYLIGRDPAVWADALAFHPDRFLDADEEQREWLGRSWMPFGRGPRACIGFALAQMEITLIIARLAQRVDLTTSLRSPRPVGMVVNRPEGGTPVTITHVTRT
jgi:cytochrome P450